MSQDHTGPFASSAGGQDQLFRKLDDLATMHMRTREDMVEVKGEVKSIAASQARVEKRQEHFEREIHEELEKRYSVVQNEIAATAALAAKRIDETAAVATKRIDEIETQVKTIREERIAEKAQWRGPEKAIAGLVGIAAAIAAIGAIIAFVMK